MIRRIVMGLYAGTITAIVAATTWGVLQGVGNGLG